MAATVSAGNRGSGQRAPSEFRAHLRGRPWLWRSGLLWIEEPNAEFRSDGARGGAVHAILCAASSVLRVARGAADRVLSKSGEYPMGSSAAQQGGAEPQRDHDRREA